MVENPTHAHDHHIEDKGDNMHLALTELEQVWWGVQDAVVTEGLHWMNVHVVPYFRRLVRVMKLMKTSVEPLQVHSFVPVVLHYTLPHHSEE